MVFVSALNDRVAPPHDPLKMVARLQAEAPRGWPLPPAAAPRLGTWRRHHADGARRAGRRRAELLLLGARHRTLVRRSQRAAGRASRGLKAVRLGPSAVVGMTRRRRRLRQASRLLDVVTADVRVPRPPAVASWMYFHPNPRLPFAEFERAALVRHAEVPRWASRTNPATGATPNVTRS